MDQRRQGCREPVGIVLRASSGTAGMTRMIRCMSLTTPRAGTVRGRRPSARPAPGYTGGFPGIHSRSAYAPARFPVPERVKECPGVRASTERGQHRTRRFAEPALVVFRHPLPEPARSPAVGGRAEADLTGSDGSRPTAQDRVMTGCPFSSPPNLRQPTGSRSACGSPRPSRGKSGAPAVPSSCPSTCRHHWPGRGELCRRQAPGPRAAAVSGFTFRRCRARATGHLHPGSVSATAARSRLRTPHAPAHRPWNIPWKPAAASCSP